ncbi:MAG: hypothetical protein AAF668_02795 [Pseudomonadota bacterium]
MKIFCHVGAPKTATTSIQQFLSAHRDALLSDFGIYLPKSIAGSQDLSHFMLNVAALDNDRDSPMKAVMGLTSESQIDALRYQVSASIEEHIKDAKLLGAKSILYTNEGLYFLNRTNELRRLLTLFTGIKPEIILFLREAISFRKSLLAQFTRNGFNVDTDGYSFLDFSSDSWLFNYDDRKLFFGNADFTDQCHVRDYSPDGVLEEFLTIIGAKNATVDQEPRLNVSPPEQVTEKEK